MYSAIAEASIKDLEIKDNRKELHTERATRKIMFSCEFRAPQGFNWLRMDATLELVLPLSIWLEGGREGEGGLWLQ